MRTLLMHHSVIKCLWVTKVYYQPTNFSSKLCLSNASLMEVGVMVLNAACMSSTNDVLIICHMFLDVISCL